MAAAFNTHKENMVSQPTQESYNPFKMDPKEWEQLIAENEKHFPGATAAFAETFEMAPEEREELTRKNEESFPGANEAFSRDMEVDMKRRRELKEKRAKQSEGRRVRDLPGPSTDDDKARWKLDAKRRMDENPCSGRERRVKKINHRKQAQNALDALTLSGSSFNQTQVVPPFLTTMPEWYKDIKRDDRKMENLSRTDDAIKPLFHLRKLINSCEMEKRKDRLEEPFKNLRIHIHDLEYLDVTKYDLKWAQMFENHIGLARIFGPGAKVKYPWDIESDAQELQRKWFIGDLETSIYRSIKHKLESARTTDNIDQTWRSLYGGTANYHGEPACPTGKWFPSQLVLVANGIHGSPQGGIYGEKGQGAYSIVISGGSGYNDEDSGDVLEYSGTASATDLPTENTQRLMESIESGNPVRVIRSSNQRKKKGAFRPVEGFRYDGLYKVVSHTVTDPKNALYKFRFERLPNQLPIRSGDSDDLNTTARPTPQDRGKRFNFNKAKEAQKAAK